LAADNDLEIKSWTNSHFLLLRAGGFLLVKAGKEILDLSYRSAETIIQQSLLCIARIDDFYTLLVSGGDDLW
jgi:hypothetical protein